MRNVLLIATVGQRYRNKLTYRNKNHRKQRSNSLTLKVRNEIRLRIAIKNVASACKKMNVLACARVSRFSFFTFTASPAWRFSFTYRGLWVKASPKRLHPLCTDAAPLKACTHTEPMGGEKRGRGSEKRPIYAGLPARFSTPVGEEVNRKGEP